MTVQFDEEPELTLIGLQESAETKVGATKFNVVLCSDPFRLAFTVALWFDVNAPAVTTKFAELAPASTVADGGSASNGLLPDRATVAFEVTI